MAETAPTCRAGRRAELTRAALESVARCVEVTWSVCAVFRGTALHHAGSLSVRMDVCAVCVCVARTCVCAQGYRSGVPVSHTLSVASLGQGL